MIIKFIYGLIEGIAKVIAWLLKILGLWVPFLYCIVFLVACALSSTEFESVSFFFFAGLILSFLCAALIAVYRPLPKKAGGGTSPYVLKPLKRKEQTDDYYAPTQKIAKKQVIREPRQEEMAELQLDEIVEPQPAPQQQPQPQRPQPKQDGNEQIDFFKKPKAKPKPEVVPPPSYQPQAYFSYDTPMIFRTRVDPNILIYEYTDRIEVYRMTNEGLTLVDVERKA